MHKRNKYRKKLFFLLKFHLKCKNMVKSLQNKKFLVASIPVLFIKILENSIKLK